MKTICIVCPSREESKEISVLLTRYFVLFLFCFVFFFFLFFVFFFLQCSSVGSLAATLSKSFDTPGDEGWGIYETSGKGGQQTERWLDPRFSLSWYWPLGTLEWKEKVGCCSDAFVLCFFFFFFFFFFFLPNRHELLSSCFSMVRGLESESTTVCPFLE
jgi:hypothetical protein